MIARSYFHRHEVDFLNQAILKVSLKHKFFLIVCCFENMYLEFMACQVIQILIRPRSMTSFAYKTMFSLVIPFFLT